VPTEKINKGKQESCEGLLVTARSSVFCFPCRWDVAEMGVRSGCIYLDGWNVLRLGVVADY